jgi:hypothetical protein
MSAVMAAQNRVQVLKESGGSIQTALSRTVRLNENSTLAREFITIIDPDIPLQLTECVGIRTVYKPGEAYSNGGYVYQTTIALKATEDLRAFRVNFLTFDVWGNHVKTLSASDIVDISAGTAFTKECEWSIYSEHETSEHYASIAYVSMVRTASGAVIAGNNTAATAEAKKFSAKFQEEDLEPTKPPKG